MYGPAAVKKLQIQPFNKLQITCYRGRSDEAVLEGGQKKSVLQIGQVITSMGIGDFSVSLSLSKVAKLM